jgi:protein-tyrosine phosphatase
LRVIEEYTLKGKDVLVHCRGGVGRAGVVAACWALKLGICGWIETEVRGVGVDEEDTKTDRCVKRDTLQMVERAIAIVRRRRSIKAIETFEQVKFLVEYVEFLRNGEDGK